MVDHCRLTTQGTIALLSPIDIDEMSGLMQYRRGETIEIVQLHALFNINLVDCQLWIRVPGPAVPLP